MRKRGIIYRFCEITEYDAIARIGAYGGSNKYVSLGATSALSKAGSGDVLGGIIVSLCAQGLPLTDSAAAGCLIHTDAGFLAESELGAYGVTADDLIKAIPYSINEIKGY